MKRIATWVVLLLPLVGASLATALPITYTASLDGASEAPANASPGTGFAKVIFDPIAHWLSVDVTFQDLVAGVTAAHIHSATADPGAGTAGVATQVPTFDGFPLGVTSGTYSNGFDLTQATAWNPAFIAANGGTPASAEASLGASLAQGTAYFNVHTAQFPGGEIRGFLVSPEPGTLILLGSGLVGLAGWSRRRSRA